MAEKRRFSLSFSLAQREQRDAWERLSAVAPGQRMDAVCRMINGYMDQQELLDAIRTVAKANIIGADLNELAPMLDASGVSTATACKVLRELLIALDKGWPGFQV